MGLEQGRLVPEAAPQVTEVKKKNMLSRLAHRYREPMTTCRAFSRAKGIGASSAVTGATSDGGVFKFTPKADYLSFGAWMSKSSAEGNAPSSPVVGVFAVGGSLTPIGGAENDTGTATYKGGATGFYAKREVGAGAGAGAYTADVELRADFENEGIVSGSVTNFQEMRTGTALGWSVKLDRAKIDTTKKDRPFEGATSSQANFEATKRT